MPEPAHERLLTYYGDDFTGSTDVMEALASHGVRTVLFTRQPTAAELAAFAGCDAIGLAGSSRSQSPAWMDEHLRPAFQWLKTLNGRFCHYKVCSTFDSSPTIGSIGRAIDIGRDVFGQQIVPLIVGAPQLKRYTAFGHLFAGYQGAVHRIDRHPVMAHHPVTPMREADLRLHLAQQTALPVGLVGLDVLARPDAAAAVDAVVAAAPGIVLLDVADPASQAAAGAQLLRLADLAGPFVTGSSGIEYALLTALTRSGSVPGTAQFPAIEPADQLAVVSGSVSPTSERQIRFAIAQGFAGIPADAVKLAADPAEEHRLTALALAELGAGRSVIVYTALGGSTDRSHDLGAHPGARHRIGAALGRIAAVLTQQAGLKRLIIAGGDTSSHALGELNIHALTTRLPLPATPGSPLCTAHSTIAAFNGLEIALKGGQVGGDDYFVALRDAASHR